MARLEKVAAVEEITARFNNSNAALLTEYRGLSVSEMAELRVALRGAEADYKVLKNTLARLAVREVGLEELIEMLEGPTAIVFCRGDAVDAAKALDEAAKKFPVLVVKGGVMDGKVIDADQAKALAKLESREVLLTKIAMLVNQPAQQTVNVLAALLRDLGSMLAQVVTQKEADAPTEPEPAPAAEAPAAEAPAAEDVAPDVAEGQEAAPEAPAEEAPTAEAPAEEAPAEETPAEETPAEETPTAEGGDQKEEE
jgi:large subunit ribosomal protein L10